MKEGRTAKTIRNSKYALLYKAVETVMAFILRTIFVKTLSVVYLGLNGVFSNVLTVLSLMDLGVGSAIAFSLYQPLADNDENKIRALMMLYKKLYRNIGILICIIGLCLTPILEYIINLPQDVPDIYMIYWLNIANTAVSYFCAYRRTILLADQKSYINYKNDILFKVIRCVCLILILCWTHNFVLYLLGDIVSTLLANVFISRKVLKIYPYLKEKKTLELEKEEKNTLWKYMKAGLLNKIGQTVVTSTDNVIISTCVSTVIVGYYSNYLMIISGVETFTYLLFSNITASVGNLAACKENGIQKVKNIFEKIQVYSHIFSTIACVGLFSLLNMFVEIWVGKGLLLDQSTVAILVLNLYIMLNLHAVSNFMGAKGDLFYRNRFRPLVEAIINLVISIVLVKYTSLGINGVFIGTTISFMCGRCWVDAYVLYKYWFDERFLKYLIRYVLRAILTALICIINYLICKVVTYIWGMNFVVFIILVMIVILITTTILYLIYRKNEAVNYWVKVLKEKF